jgi:hypothetical protein
MNTSKNQPETVVGRVNALINDAVPAPNHPPFKSESLKVTTVPLSITGVVGEGGGFREVNFFFDKAYKDGSYELPMAQARTWGRYIDSGIFYYSFSAGVMRLTVKNNGSHYSGGFERVDFREDSDIGNARCTLTASFEADISR